MLRNSAPISGISPRMGKALMFAVRLFLMRPPIAKLCPSASCTVVDALRVVLYGGLREVDEPGPDHLEHIIFATIDDSAPLVVRVLRTIGFYMRLTRGVSTELLGKDVDLIA